jgi:hypothetical protein
MILMVTNFVYMLAKIQFILNMKNSKVSESVGKDKKNFLTHEFFWKMMSWCQICVRQKLPELRHPQVGLGWIHSYLLTNWKCNCLGLSPISECDATVNLVRHVPRNGWMTLTITRQNSPYSDLHVAREYNTGCFIRSSTSDFFITLHIGKVYDCMKQF